MAGLTLRRAVASAASREDALPIFTGARIWSRQVTRTAGESEQVGKASVSGGRLSAIHQARYLLDALRPFAGRTVRIEHQEGLRPTVFNRPAGRRRD